MQNPSRVRRARAAIHRCTSVGIPKAIHHHFEECSLLLADQPQNVARAHEI
jgi:hypothetical protein